MRDFPFNFYYFECILLGYDLLLCFQFGGIIVVLYVHEYDQIKFMLQASQETKSKGRCIYPFHQVMFVALHHVLKEDDQNLKLSLLLLLLNSSCIFSNCSSIVQCQRAHKTSGLFVMFAKST